MEDLSTVQDEFKQDQVYLAKVVNLASKYSKIRRTRPDGNCFFRALAFAYFEKVNVLECLIRLIGVIFLIPTILIN